MKWYKRPMLWLLVTVCFYTIGLILYLKWHNPPEIKHPYQAIKEDTLQSLITISDTVYFSLSDTAQVWRDSLHIIHVDSNGVVIKEFILYYR